MCRYDIIAQIYYARRLAQKLYPVARMIDLHGGHLVSHERPEEVFDLLIDSDHWNYEVGHYIGRSYIYGNSKIWVLTAKVSS